MTEFKFSAFSGGASNRYSNRGRHKYRSKHPLQITPVGNPGPPHKTCQWLYGEAKERDFCGKPVREGSSYCSEHHAVCYVKPLSAEEFKRRKEVKK